MPSPPDPVAPRVIRVWPAAVLIVAYWYAVFYIHNTDMAMLPRFISRCVIWFVTVLVFIGWWMSNRRIGWRDRLGALGWLIVMTVVAGVLSHPSAIAVLVIDGLPIVFTAWTIWLALSRRWQPQTQRIGFALVLPLTLIPILLVRCEGIDGTQRTVLKWRWTPSGEELFLTSRVAAKSTASTAREWIVQPGDWPEFRGPRRDGVVKGLSIRGDWQAVPPRLVWRQRIGPGWSSMIVVDGFLFTQEQRGELEAIVCYDAATGKEIWSYESPGRFNEAVSGLGPRATPTFYQGLICALGATGQLTCVSADTGHKIWSRDIKAECGAKVPQWGYSSSPLVVRAHGLRGMASAHEDLVIVFAGGDRGRSLIACRTETGEVAWAHGDGTLSYSSPQLVEWQGIKQILMLDNISMAGINPWDGKPVWQRLTGGQMEDPMIQPHVLNESSLVISAGSGLARFDRKPGDRIVFDRWKSNSLKPDFNDVVIHAGYIYGLDDGILCCVDLETGRRVWKRGRYGHGQILLLADQARLLVACETGEITLVAAKPDRHEELGRFQAIEGKLWNHPVIAGGRLYVRNGEEMACYEL